MESHEVFSHYREADKADVRCENLGPYQRENLGVEIVCV
jgi:hypothetical protein